MCMSSPKPPKLPDPPAPPRFDDARATATDESRRRRASNRGFASTLLTGGDGVTDQARTTNTLLGR